MPAAAKETAAGELSAELLRRAARFQVAVAIRKANDATGVGDVKIQRVWTGRIQGDAKRLVQLFFGEDFGLLGFAVAIAIAHDFDRDAAIEIGVGKRTSCQPDAVSLVAVVCARTMPLVSQRPTVWGPTLAAAL